MSFLREPLHLAGEHYRALPVGYQDDGTPTERPRSWDRHPPRRTGEQHTRPLLFKGGDPAAPSGTATLLRLRPSYQARPRRLPPLRVSSATSIVLGFHDVTGGVYKARERIHRSMLTCGY